MIGSSKRCTSVTKPIQLQSNPHGLNSLRLTHQGLQHLRQLQQLQQTQRKQAQHQRAERRLFLKLHKKFLRQHPLLLHQLHKQRHKFRHQLFLRQRQLLLHLLHNQHLLLQRHKFPHQLPHKLQLSLRRF
jgi:hypothetical protein